jgi:large conductance mechanosensitive channel
VIRGFKEFVARGSVIDLAVGVIIGAAFGEIVTSLVKDVLTPAIGAIGGNPDFSTVTLGPLKIGNFVNALLAFVLKAAGLYFFIVVPYMRFRGPVAVPPPTPTETLLTEIRDLLKPSATTRGL